MTYREIFEHQMLMRGLKWCKKCDSRSGHKRGFVLNSDKTTVHFDSKIMTRSTLFNGLHEIGHCVNSERGLRAYECERDAEDFARKIFREHGIPIPQKRARLGAAYIARKKRHGDAIKNG